MGHAQSLPKFAGLRKKILMFCIIKAGAFVILIVSEVLSLLSHNSHSFSSDIYEYTIP